ncbi:MAG: hypothetical protein ACRC33_03905 [Gemmataceae bacterium]
MRVGDLATLIGLRGSWRSTAGPLQAFLRRAGVRLLVRVPWFGDVEVFPRPNFLLRMALPRT